MRAGRVNSRIGRVRASVWRDKESCNSCTDLSHNQDFFSGIQDITDMAK